MTFEPHGWCLLWNTSLVTTHVVGDALIAIAYFLIPTVLFSLRRLFTSWDFPRIALFLFGSFIFGCGCTHVMDIIVLWYPVYWLQAVIKMITAIISCLTFAYLFYSLTGRRSVVDLINRNLHSLNL